MNIILRFSISHLQALKNTLLAMVPCIVLCHMLVYACFLFCGGAMFDIGAMIEAVTSTFLEALARNYVRIAARLPMSSHLCVAISSIFSNLSSSLCLTKELLFRELKVLN